MDRGGPSRLLLVGRSCYLGILWGAVYGGVTYLAVCLAYLAKGGLLGLFFIQVACYVGGVIGGASGLLAGLALAISGPRVTCRLPRARLVGGSAAAAVPLAVAWYLHEAHPTFYASLWAWVGPVSAVAAATAMWLTPRVLDGAAPPTYVYFPVPPGPTPVPPGPTPIPPGPTPVSSVARTGDDPAPAAERDAESTEAQPPFQRRLIVGRGLGWGIISGTALGAFSWTVLCVEVGEFHTMTVVGFAAVVGALLGACLGLAAGVALAFSGRRVAEQMYRAQLVAGGVVTAIPLAVVYLSRPHTPWAYAYLLSPVNLAVVAALTAVLLTPRILLGAPQRRSSELHAGGADHHPGAAR